MPVAVNKDTCSGCGICIKACPEANVIKRTDDGKVAINATFCKMCTLCASVCPKDSIKSEG
jgi:Pyruvate/2-oxoacid:ferredoxin oxidoreductase delta subunit